METAMKKILLAISGASPHEETLRYSLGLAQRLRAKLEVLQVTGPSIENRWRKVIDGVRSGRRLFEETMAASAFAEAGEVETARNIKEMMARAEQAIDNGLGPRVEYHVTMRQGEPEKEIVRFVEKNRDIVLAVYDAEASGTDSVFPEQLRKILAIPTVAIKKNSDRGGEMKKLSLKRKSSLNKLSDKMDQVQEAVTYAEANMPEEAIRVMERMEKAPSMILVLGRGHSFSAELKDYAVGLAKRLGYEIVSVNTKYIPNDFLPLVSSYRDRLRQDFSSMAGEAGDEFRRQCEREGVPFRHMVKFGDGASVIKELHREFKNLEYVVTEPDESAERAPGVMPAIPVFSLAVS
jgi:nucleotide-binding universal stress UspA family protein